MQKHKTSLIGTLLILFASSAYADFASLAHNSVTNAVGTGYGYKSSEDAGATALKACKQYSMGKAGCKVVLITKFCFVVISDENKNRTWTEARSIHIARKTARAECKANNKTKCQVIISACA